MRPNDEDAHAPGDGGEHAGRRVRGSDEPPNSDPQRTTQQAGREDVRTMPEPENTPRVRREFAEFVNCAQTDTERENHPQGRRAAGLGHARAPVKSAPGDDSERRAQGPAVLVRALGGPDGHRARVRARAGGGGVPGVLGAGARDFGVGLETGKNRPQLLPGQRTPRAQPGPASPRGVRRRVLGLRAFTAGPPPRPPGTARGGGVQRECARKHRNSGGRGSSRAGGVRGVLIAPKSHILARLAAGRGEQRLFPGERDFRAGAARDGAGGAPGGVRGLSAASNRVRRGRLSSARVLGGSRAGRAGVSGDADGAGRVDLDAAVPAGGGDPGGPGADRKPLVFEQLGRGRDGAGERAGGGDGGVLPVRGAEKAQIRRGERADRGRGGELHGDRVGRGGVPGWSGNN